MRLEDARGRCFQLVVGGDFNTQLNTRFRGTLLQDVVEMFDLTFTNELPSSPDGPHSLLMLPAPALSQTC